MWKTIGKYNQHYHPPCDFGLHAGPTCNPLSRPGAFFSDLVFGTPAWHPLRPIVSSPGPPLERIGPLPGQPWSDAPYLLDEFRNNFAPDVNDFFTRFPYFVNNRIIPACDTNKKNMIGQSSTRHSTSGCWLCRSNIEQNGAIRSFDAEPSLRQIKSMHGRWTNANVSSRQGHKQQSYT